MHIEMQTAERHWLLPPKRYHLLLTYFQGCFVRWPNPLKALDSLPGGLVAQTEEKLCDVVGQWMAQPGKQTWAKPWLCVGMAEIGTHPTIGIVKRLVRCLFWLAIMALLIFRFVLTK
jgi:hypothetical protein